MAPLAAPVGETEAMPASEAATTRGPVKLARTTAAPLAAYAAGAGEPLALTAVVWPRGLHADAFFDLVPRSPSTGNLVGQAQQRRSILATLHRAAHGRHAFPDRGSDRPQRPGGRRRTRNSTPRTTSKMSNTQHSSTVRFLSWWAPAPAARAAHLCVPPFS